MADTDEEEPVNKVRRMGVGGGRMEDGGIPRLVDLFASPSFSPAATLLRYKGIFLKGSEAYFFQHLYVYSMSPSHN